MDHILAPQCVSCMKVSSEKLQRSLVPQPNKAKAILSVRREIAYYRDKLVTLLFIKTLNC